MARHREIGSKGAWKLGGTNWKSKATFRNESPLFGFIPSNSVYMSGSQVPFSLNTCIELELAVRVPKNQHDELQYALCFEIPQMRLGQSAPGIEDVLADRCGAHNLVIQDRFQYCNLEQLSNSTFNVHAGGSQLELKGLGNLIASPREIMDEFLRFAATRNILPIAGQPVAIGGLGDSFTVYQGQYYASENQLLGTVEVVFS